MKDYGHELKEGSFSLGVRGKNITMRLSKYQSRLPRKAVQCPSLVSRPDRIKP